MTTGLLKVPASWEVLYHCVDRIDAQPGMPREQIHELERDLVRLADEVFVTSRELEREWRAVRHDVRYSPNCVDARHFSVRRPVPAEWDAVSAPRIGFVGAMAEYKVDYELLDAVFSARPEWSLVLIGPDQDSSPRFRQLCSRPNVYWLGKRSYGEVPAYMQHLDVGIIPAKMNDYTAAMFPMKFFEYLAAGIPVVATRLDALAEYAGLCELTSGAEEFTDAVERALKEKTLRPEIYSVVLAENSYVARTERMVSSLRVRPE
jgi:glycosyltransferase involved in cell wall biosynthesis